MSGEVILSAPVQAKHFVDLPDDGSEPAGAFTYYTDNRGGNRGMIYACPCGCGRHGALPFRPPSEDDIKYKRHSWDWDGNEQSPTLSPSVHHVGHWHGYLRGGQWVQA